MRTRGGRSGTRPRVPQGPKGARHLVAPWPHAGDRPVRHVEPHYLSWGATPAEALAPLLALSLEAVKQLLDACIARQERG